MKSFPFFGNIAIPIHLICTFFPAQGNVLFLLKGMFFFSENFKELIRKSDEMCKVTQQKMGV